MTRELEEGIEEKTREVYSIGDSETIPEDQGISNEFLKFCYMTS